MSDVHSPLPKSIAGRLVAFSAMFVLATVVVTSAVLWLILIGVVREQIDQRLDVQIEGLREAISVSSAGKVALSGGFDNPPFDRPGSGWYWQVEGKDARLTSRSLQGETLEHPPLPVDWRRLLTGEPRAADGQHSAGRALHFRFLRTVVGGVPIEITATAPASALRSPAFAALFWLLPGMVSLGLVLIFGVFLQVRYGLAPIRRLRQEIVDVSSGRAPAVSDYTAGELQPVAVELNRLIEQSRKRLAETRLHFANLAHGLKTPVASLAVALDDRTDPDGTLRILTERIDKRVRHHLARTRATLSDAGLFASTSVRPRVEDILNMMTRIYADKGVKVCGHFETDESVACGSDDLEEVIGAVVDNAFKWAVSHVDITVRRVGEMVSISVVDDGPGIKDDNILKATLPGIRLDESVPGDGFGLSIAKEIAELHGGRLSLSNNAAGGLTADIMLPISKRPAASNRKDP
jgi:signal transduction histidine kinase